VTPEQLRTCRQVIAVHSKSFALASRLLPQDTRDDACAVYAWCRHADDAVDLVSAAEQPAALRRIRDELGNIYAGKVQPNAVLDAFQEVVMRRRIPREYPDELLAGMEMDVVGAEYGSVDDLLKYCFRVAGTVGLMMCHVFGVREASAVRHAAHLGMAMQLTNICRDVVEDWRRGRLYVPDSLLHSCGAPDLRAKLGAPLPSASGAPLGCAVQRLLSEAERFYRSGDRGLSMLSWRTALAVRTARLVYSRIGDQIAAHGHDVFAGRMFVPRRKKLRLLVRAVAEEGTEAPSRLRREFFCVPLSTIVRFPTDVLPV
jgi:phytoene synthase